MMMVVMDLKIPETIIIKKITFKKYKALMKKNHTSKRKSKINFKMKINFIAKRRSEVKNPI